MNFDIEEHMSRVIETNRRKEEEREKRKLIVLKTACPSCDPDSEKAYRCEFIGKDVCKFAGLFALRARVKELWRQARVCHLPRRHVSLLAYSLEKPEDSIALDLERTAMSAVQKLVQGGGQFVVLAGAAGAGKSLAATWAIARAREVGLFLRASQLEGYNDQATQLLIECIEKPLLVIDDLGAGPSGSKLVATRVEEILCTRWDEQRPTVVTTNLMDDRSPLADGLLKPTSFWRYYGGLSSRIMDRLDADPIGWVNCPEDSGRFKARAAPADAERKPQRRTTKRASKGRS